MKFCVATKPLIFIGLKKKILLNYLRPYSPQFKHFTSLTYKLTKLSQQLEKEIKKKFWNIIYIEFKGRGLYFFSINKNSSKIITIMITLFLPHRVRIILFTFFTFHFVSLIFSFELLLINFPLRSGIKEISRKTLNVYTWCCKPAERNEMKNIISSNKYDELI